MERVPAATAEATRRSMQGNRRRDTKPELALRRELFSRGLRYRVDYPIRVDDGRPIRADIAFTRAKVAVFVDGCFWHGCPQHQVIPARNRDYWASKFRRNADRDRKTEARMSEAGWQVIRVWEHESPVDAAQTIDRVIKGSRAA